MIAARHAVEYASTVRVWFDSARIGLARSRLCRHSCPARAFDPSEQPQHKPLAAHARAIAIFSTRAANPTAPTTTSAPIT